MRKRLEDPAFWRLIALGGIAVGAVLRILWVLVLHQPQDFHFVYSDMSRYVATAAHTAAGGPADPYQAFQAPGTHLLLALPFWVFGTNDTGLRAGAVLWCALSVVTPYCMWRFAQLLLRPAAAALTAVFVALWPLHIAYAGYFLSETPALALLVGFLWLGHRSLHVSGRAAVAAGLMGGAVAGFAAGTRPQLLLNIGLVVLTLLAAGRPARRALLAFGGATLAVIVAFLVHNAIAVNHPTGLSLNSGVVFFHGQCHDWYVTAVAGAYRYQDGFPVATQLGRRRRPVFRGHHIYDQGFFYSQAFQCIRRHGLGHARYLAQNVVDATGTTIPWPMVNDQGYKREVVERANSGLSLALPALILAGLLLGVARRGSAESRGVAILLAHLACFIPVAMFAGDPRYRQTYDVFALAILAALVAAVVLDRGRRRVSA